MKIIILNKYDEQKQLFDNIKIRKCVFDVIYKYKKVAGCFGILFFSGIEEVFWKNTG